MKETGKVLQFARGIAVVSLSLALHNCSNNAPKNVFDNANSKGSFVVSTIDDRVLHPAEFLVNGKTIEQRPAGMGRIERYRYTRAVNKYKTVINCLPASAVQNGKIDLTQVDWRKITGLIRIKVCLQRIAYAIGDQVEVARWFETQGIQAKARDIFGKWPTEHEVRVYAGMSGETLRNSPVFGTGRFFFMRKMAHSVSLAVVYDLTDQIESINITFNYK